MKTKFSKNIPLQIPMVSSPMDTVTEHNMAIGMARNGAIGVIHRYQTIEDQVKMIKLVKRAENFIIQQPYIIDENESIDRVLEIQKDLGIKSFLVTSLPNERRDSIHNKKGWSSYDVHKRAFAFKREEDKPSEFKLSGIITARDLKASRTKGQIVSDVMTRREKLKVFTK